MNKLEELEEELYGKAEGEEITRRMNKKLSLPGTLRNPSLSWLGRDKKPSVPGGSRGYNFFKLFLVILFFLSLVGGSLFLFLYLGTKGQEAKVTIEGQDRIESGATLTIPIVFKNVSNTVLKEVEFSVVLPPGSKIYEEGFEHDVPLRLTRKLDDIGPGEEKIVEVAARFFGKEGEEKAVDATMLYRPENLHARFSTKDSKKFVIGRVPLAVSWEVPGKLTRNQEVEAKIHYSSQSGKNFEGMSLLVEYPPGFTFETSNPKSDVGDTVWDIGTVEPGKEGVIVIRGKIIGEEGDVKSFRGGLGIFDKLTKEWKPYVESNEETKIEVNLLSLQIFFRGAREGVIVPGDQLDFTVRFRNNTDFTLKNLTVKAFLEGGPISSKELAYAPNSSEGQSILQLNSLSLDKGGVFDVSSGALLWGPGGTEVLRDVKTGEGGELNFHIKTKDSPIMRAGKDKNFVVRVRSVIDPAQIPKELAGTNLHSEDTLEIKVKSRVLFSGRAIYHSSPILNSGPLPPRVGQKTTYNILWEVRNFTNDLENVEIHASLPPNSKWENAISPKDARIVYDQASGDVRWKIGTVKAGIGVINPALVGAFQVSIIPSEGDVDKSPILLHRSSLTARDSFTSDVMEAVLPDLSTEIREDLSAEFDTWKVRK